VEVGQMVNSYPPTQGHGRCMEDPPNARATTKPAKIQATPTETRRLPHGHETCTERGTTPPTVSHDIRGRNTGPKKNTGNGDYSESISQPTIPTASANAPKLGCDILHTRAPTIPMGTLKAGQGCEI
jgi:hypothetical protein